MFTYRCGLLQWGGTPTVGWNAGGEYFFNHPFSGSNDALDLACLNEPVTEWNNLVYNISIGTVIPTVPPSTVEPRKMMLAVLVVQVFHVSNYILQLKLST